jgi:signal transduction histidine kinase
MDAESVENAQSSQVLQTREQLHEALFEYNPSQTIVVDNEGRIITYNKAKRESGDRLPNDGDIMFKDYAGKYDIDMYCELTECIRTGQTRVFPEQKYMDKILSTTIAPFPGGAIIITEDVTDDKNAEQFNKALFEYNPSQTIVVDDQGRIITYNQAKRESGDRLPEPSDVMFKDYAGRYDIDMYSELTECIRTGQTKELPEQKYMDKILSTTISPFPGGAIIITEDVTAMVQAERELKKANEDLKEKNRLQTAFVTNVSHELRTALCIFKNTISNLTAGGKGKIDRKLRDSFQIADDSVGRLARVIDDFIELSEIETGKLQLSCTELDLRPVISKLADSMMPLAKDRKIKLKTIIRDRNLPVHADRDKIERVIRHLIDNAIKFAPEGGKIELRSQDLGDQIGMDVEDNGPGISNDNLEKVFDCFVKIQEPHMTGVAGVGLGLTLAKQLVEMHGGRIWAESTLGQGSTFHIVVPKHA